MTPLSREHVLQWKSLKSFRVDPPGTLSRVDLDIDSDWTRVYGSPRSWVSVDPQRRLSDCKTSGVTFLFCTLECLADFHTMVTCRMCVASRLSTVLKTIRKASAALVSILYQQYKLSSYCGTARFESVSQLSPKRNELRTKRSVPILSGNITISRQPLDQTA